MGKNFNHRNAHGLKWYWVSSSLKRAVSPRSAGAILSYASMPLASTSATMPSCRIQMQSATSSASHRSAPAGSCTQRDAFIDLSIESSCKLQLAIYEWSLRGTRGNPFMCLDNIGIHLSSDALMQDPDAIRHVISFRGLRPQEAANRSAFVLCPRIHGWATCYFVACCPSPKYRCPRAVHRPSLPRHQPLSMYCSKSGSTVVPIKAASCHKYSLHCLREVMIDRQLTYNHPFGAISISGAHIHNRYMMK